MPLPEVSGKRGDVVETDSLPLRDIEGAVVPGRGIEEHAMMMQSCGFGEGVGGVDNQGVVRADLYRRGPVCCVKKKVKRGAGNKREITYGQEPLTPMTRRSARPSGFTPWT